MYKDLDNTSRLSAGLRLTDKEGAQIYINSSCFHGFSICTSWPMGHCLMTQIVEMMVL